MRRRTLPLDPAELRAQAERMAAGGPAPEAAQHSDVLRQLHELQVSQIELEMQQEALLEMRQQKEEAEAGRDRYAELYDLAPASYFSLHADGRIVRLNVAAGSLLGRPCPQLLGQPFEQFVAPAEQARLRRFLAELFADGARGALEVDLFEGVASARRIRIESNLDPIGNVCRMIVSDISELHARETARQRACLVLDNIDEAVMVTDAANRIVSVNPAFSRITGYAAEEVIGRDPSFLGRGANPAALHAAAWNALHACGSWQGEVHNYRRDHSQFIAAMSLTVLRADDGSVAGYVGVFSDISARKRAERALHDLSRQLDTRVVERTTELTETNRLLRQEVAERIRVEAELRQSREQLRQLAEHLATVKENERKRIAREIHDELGQNLLALRLDVSMLRARTETSHPRLHRRVDAVLNNVDTTIRSVRGIMNELRPPVLDLGLQAAIEWQAGEFRKRSGLACHIVVPDERIFGAIPADVEIVLFRSLQESLTNVMRHAQASTVEIVLAAGQGRLTLSVADDGVGIAPQHRGKQHSFGLIGIAERVGALGGCFDIDAYESGCGCTLTMSFALDVTAPVGAREGAV